MTHFADPARMISAQVDSAYHQNVKNNTNKARFINTKFLRLLIIANRNGGVFMFYSHFSKTSIRMIVSLMVDFYTREVCNLKANHRSMNWKLGIFFQIAIYNQQIKGGLQSFFLSLPLILLLLKLQRHSTYDMILDQKQWITNFIHYLSHCCWMVHFFYSFAKSREHAIN